MVLACVLVSPQASEAVRLKAQTWSEFLQAPLNPENLLEFSFRLKFTEAEVRLEDNHGRTLRIDFLTDHINYQRKGMRGKNELLAKALGIGKGVHKVLDLSAGLGIDAVFMTQLGFQVTAVERSRLLYILLTEALQKAPELQTSLSFVCSESLRYLESGSEVNSFEGIYFDPMYPHKKKSALPKQEMVVFRELVGQDDDAAKVLEKALKTNAKRIVVKRPVQAPQLLPGVRHSYEGKVVRYDVYMRSI